MKKLAALTLSLFLAVGTVLADTPKDATPQAAKTAQKARPRAAAKQADKSAEIAAQIEELRKSLQAQQEQIQQLKNELARRDQQITDARNAAAAAVSEAWEAGAKATAAVASTAEAKTASSTLVSDVNDLKLGSETLKVAVQDTQKKIISAESPSTIHYKGVNLTPGGFIEAATVFRQRATSSDINTPFNSIPYPGNALGKVTEKNYTIWWLLRRPSSFSPNPEWRCAVSAQICDGIILTNKTPPPMKKKWSTVWELYASKGQKTLRIFILLFLPDPSYPAPSPPIRH